MGGRRLQATESTIKVLALITNGQVLVYSTLCMGIDEIGQVFGTRALSITMVDFKRVIRTPTQCESMVRVATELRNMLERTDFSDEKRDQKSKWTSAV